VVFTSDEKFLSTKKIKDYNDLLIEHDFIRVHQSYMINMNHILKFVKSDGSYLIMTDKSSIPISRGFKNAFMIQLEKYG